MNPRYREPLKLTLLRDTKLWSSLSLLPKSNVLKNQNFRLLLVSMNDRAYKPCDRGKGYLQENVYVLAKIILVGLKRLQMR